MYAELRGLTHAWSRRSGSTLARRGSAPTFAGQIMPRARPKTLSTLTVALAMAGCQSVAAQVPPPGNLRPVELVSPVYPPIAVSARVSGDVTLVVRVRPDGGIGGIDVARGVPLLTEASQRAAEASRFECLGCVAEQEHTITYSFGFDLTPREPETDPQSGSRVQVTAASPFVIPLFSNISARSIKCLYLWHCGTQWGGMDFYNYRIRSGRCAWLWKCGWRRRGASTSAESQSAG